MHVLQRCCRRHILNDCSVVEKCQICFYVCLKRPFYLGFVQIMSSLSEGFGASYVPVILLSNRESFR